MWVEAVQIAEARYDGRSWDDWTWSTLWSIDVVKGNIYELKWKLENKDNGFFFKITYIMESLQFQPVGFVCVCVCVCVCDETRLPH